MSKPFDIGSAWVVILDNGDWREFPTEAEADEFINERLAE